MKTIQTKLLAFAFLLSFSSYSQSQWEDSGTNIPVLNNSRTPVVHYSDSLNQLYLLRQSETSSITFFDTLSRITDEWGVYSSQISAVDFVTTNDGKLTFIDTTANSFTLTCYDAQLNQFWTSSPPAGSVDVLGLITGSAIVKGVGNDYFVCFVDAQNNYHKVMKYDGSSWTNLGAIAPFMRELKVNSSGVPHVVYMEYDTNNSVWIYSIESHDGTQWNVVATHQMSDTPSWINCSLAIDENDDLYLSYLYTNQFTFSLLCNIERFSNGVHTTIDSAVQVPLSESEAYYFTLFDRNNQFHGFYRTYSLGYTGLVHFTKDLQTNGWSTYTPYAEPLTPGGNPGYQTTLTATVDELNCIHYALDQDRDIYDPLVLDSVVVRKRCECSYLDSINTVTLEENNELSSSFNSFPMSYQWIDCSTNTPISGATNATFTPTQNGSYAVITSSANSCSDTSNCVVVSTIGLVEQLLSRYTLYPNPATNQITLLGEGSAVDNVQMAILDLTGKVLLELETKLGETIRLDHLSVGHYFIRIEENESIITIPFVKE